MAIFATIPGDGISKFLAQDETGSFLDRMKSEQLSMLKLQEIEKKLCDEEITLVEALTESYAVGLDTKAAKPQPYSNAVKAEIARLDRRSTYLEGLIINSAHQSYGNSDELQKEFVSKVDYVNFIIRTVPRP